MKDISSLFDYFKKAFQLNKSNKELYLPQVALILTKAAMFIAFGVILYQFAMDVGEVGFGVESLIEYAKTMAWWGVGLVFITAVGGIVVESGLYNMYKTSLNEEALTMTVFTDGVSEYFFRMLFANLLLLVFWFIILIPYVIIGIITLFAGFVLIPILITIFTTMWKVSIVMDDMKVMDGLRNGINFAKANFKPLAVLMIIKSAFLSSAGGSGGSGNSGSSNWNNTGDISHVDMGFESFQEGYVQALPYIKTGFFVAIPVISIAIIIGSLVKMVFEIFFNLSIFVMYNETVKDENLSEAFEQLPSDDLNMEVE